MKYATQTGLFHFYKVELKHMSPKQFLELATPLTVTDDIFDEKLYKRDKLVKVRANLVRELEQRPLEMTVDVDTGEVITHRGRNIAFSAYQLNIKKIPVFVKYVRYVEEQRGKKKKVKIIEEKVPKNVKLRRSEKEYNVRYRKKRKNIRWVHD